MSLKPALNTWLMARTGLPCYWMSRPAGAEIAVVYRCITPGVIEGNLAPTGLARDVYSISLYHSNADEGDRLIVLVQKGLLDLQRNLAGYPVEDVTFSGGFENRLDGEIGQPQYLFNRDFTFTH